MACVTHSTVHCDEGFIVLKFRFQRFESRFKEKPSQAMGEPAKRKAPAGGVEAGNTKYWPKKSKKEKKGADGEPQKEKKSSRKREGEEGSTDVATKKKKSKEDKSSGKKKAKVVSKDGGGAAATKGDGEFVNKVPQNHKEQRELAIKRKKDRNPHFDMVQTVCYPLPRIATPSPRTCPHVHTRAD